MNIDNIEELIEATKNAAKAEEQRIFLEKEKIEIEKKKLLVEEQNYKSLQEILIKLSFLSNILENDFEPNLKKSVDNSEISVELLKLLCTTAYSNNKINISEILNNIIKNSPTINVNTNNNKNFNSENDVNLNSNGNINV